MFLFLKYQINETSTFTFVSSKDFRIYISNIDKRVIKERKIRIQETKNNWKIISSHPMQ